MDQVACEAVAEIDAVRQALQDAATALQDAAERGLAALSAQDAAGARDALNAVLAETSFADLNGHRLARCRDRLSGDNLDARADAHLLEGPARRGEGLGQEAIDGYFSD